VSSSGTPGVRPATVTAEPQLRRLAAGVHAWIGARGDSNAGAIETPDGTLLIDAQQHAGRLFASGPISCFVGAVLDLLLRMRGDIILPSSTSDMATACGLVLMTWPRPSRTKGHRRSDRQTNDTHETHT